MSLRRMVQCLTLAAACHFIATSAFDAVANARPPKESGRLETGDETHPKDIPTWQTESDLGVRAYQRKNYPEAELHTRQAYLDLLLAEPKNHVALEQCLRLLSMVLFLQEKNAEARVFAEKALEVGRRVSPPSVRLAAQRLTLMARIDLVDGNLEAAEASCLEARSIIESEFGKESMFLIGSLLELSHVYNKTKRYADADDVASLALTIAERASLGQSSETASLLESRGETRYSQRRFSEGQQDIARALEIRLKERPPRHDRVIEDYNLFATFCMAQEKFDEAIKAFHLVADSRKRRFGPSHPAYGWALSNLAFCYAGRGRWDDAEPVAREGFGILNGQQNRLHAAPDLARAADCLGRICLAKHKLADAEAYLKIAIAILDEFGDKEIDRTPLLRNYANTLERLGRRAEAQVFWKRIHESPQGEHPAGYVEY